MTPNPAHFHGNQPVVGASQGDPLPGFNYFLVGFYGTWKIPEGRPEIPESPREEMARDLEEVAGLSVDPDAPVSLYDDAKAVGEDVRTAYSVVDRSRVSANAPNPTVRMIPPLTARTGRYPILAAVRGNNNGPVPRPRKVALFRRLSAPAR